MKHLAPGVAQTIVVTGRRGYGKTTAIDAYLEVLENRVLVLSQHPREYESFPLSPSIEDALRDFYERPVCRRRVLCGLEARRGMPQCIELINKHLRNAMVAITELQTVYDQEGGPELDYIITQGRHLGLRTISDAQQLKKVPYVLQAEATSLVSCRVTRPRDVEAIDDWAGEAAAERVRSLAVGQCLLVDL